MLSFDPILTFDASLDFFLYHFRIILGHFSPFVAIFTAIFTVILRFLVMFWEVDCKLKQNDAREGNNMQSMQKCPKTSLFFASKPLVLPKKKVKIDVSTNESVVRGCVWNDAELIWQISAKLHQKLCEIVQKQVFLSAYKTLVYIK